jgi:hypothetical protein
MNDRSRVRLATLVALLVAVPTTMQGAPGGQAFAPSGAPTASAPTAAEAARLAAAAADMAQRAAQIASAAEQSSNSSASTAWRRRGEAERPAAQVFAPANAAAAHAAATDAHPWRAFPTAQPEPAQPAKLEPQARSAENDVLASLAAVSNSTLSDTLVGKSPEIPVIDEAADPAARYYADSEVVPVSNAQYPEATAAADTPFATPVSYEACSDGCCEMECCPPPRTLFWTVGIEATFLNPDLNASTPTLRAEDITLDRVTSFSAGDADVDSFYVAPRMWLGIQGCKWGTGVRYWHMQASEFEYDGFFNNRGSSNFGIPDASYFSTGRLDAYTIDWEINRLFCVHSCQMMLSGGVRYAYLETDSSVTGLVETLADPMDEETTVLLSGYGRGNALTRGTGVFLGLQGKQPLFTDSCIHLFWNVKGSVLWGSTETSAESSASVMVFDPDDPGNAATVNSANTAVDDDMWIGEFQLGLEWDYCLCCVPANAFVRLAAEYQRWDGGPGSSRTGAEAFAEVNGDDVAVLTTQADAFGPQLDLVGLALGAGLTW